MLEVSDLTVAYGPHRALESVALTVAPGEICVILGANGAGKSTLLKAIAGMVKPHPGATIAMDGHDIAHEKPNRVVEAGLALVPEGRGIFGDLTVAENLQLGAYGNQARATEATRIDEVYALFPKLKERRGQVARTMSGGEQQMVAIGRALMSSPKILMLDEPSLGLSPLLTRELFRSLTAVRETGVGILLVEQNAKQSLAIADRGYLLENGHIVGEDRADRLAGDPAVQAAYLGGAASSEAPLAIPSRAARPTVTTPATTTPTHAPAPLAPAATGDGAAALAARAAAIQRGYLEQLRQAGTGGANGRSAAPASSRGASVPAPASTILPAVPAAASDLSRQAEAFARRARDIQTRHLAEIRGKTSIWSILSPSHSIETGKRR